MINATLDECTQELRNDPLPGERDADAKNMVWALFDAFVAQRVVKERGCGWDVEQDAMDWETAIGGMQTLERKLRELRNIRPGR